MTLLVSKERLAKLLIDHPLVTGVGIGDEHLIVYAKEDNQTLRALVPTTYDDILVKIVVTGAIVAS